MESMIRPYSRTRDGAKQLTANFKVREFACRDGSDPIFIAPALAEVLQSVRSHFQQPVTVCSGYHTPGYNRRVDGAAYSQHLYGRAADIQVKGVDPKQVAAFVETIMPDRGGIGIYPTFTHIDVREKRSRWTEN